jgi:hypothetical protein
MNEIYLDKDIYLKAKSKADKVYKTHGAYKSMYIVKLYKDMGGRFNPEYKDKKLTKWLNEKWIDIGGSNNIYPVYRPTVKMDLNTPLTINEIEPTNLKQQIKLKQKIKASKNLPPFKEKYINIMDVEKSHPIYKYSNPEKLRINANKMGFSNIDIYLSDKPDKKYFLIHPETNKKIYFGQSNFEDYLAHNDEKRRTRFKNRNKKWASLDKFTPGYISYFLSWD